MVKLFKATVADNAVGSGRIRYRYKHPIDSDIENLPIAEYCSPFGGGDNIEGAGMFFMPEVGSMVWILDEENTTTIWIGSSFFDIAGRQNIPIEANSLSVEPTIRMIKSIRGHKLIFDDRPQKINGDPVDDVVLTNGSGSGLVINESSKTRGIRLAFEKQNAGLQFNDNGAYFVSNKKNGLYINDSINSISLSDYKQPPESSFIEIQNGMVSIKGQRGIAIITPSQLKLESRTGFEFKTLGKYNIKTGNSKFITTNDFVVQTGNNFLVNSNQFTFAGQAESNFSIDLPIPGLPGLNQGNISLVTAGGGILLKNGLSTTPTAIVPTTFTNNDILINGRLAIGDSVSGNALLEGRIGGIFISGTPVLLPGTAGGFGGRLPIPLAPIAPATPTIIPTPLPPFTPVPLLPIVGIGPQPAVLGGNLYFMLTRLLRNLEILASQHLAGTPAIAAGPFGPVILNPLVAGQWATFYAEIVTMLNTNLSVAPLPTNILSSTLFIDG